MAHDRKVGLLLLIQQKLNFCLLAYLLRAITRRWNSWIDSYENIYDAVFDLDDIAFVAGNVLQKNLKIALFNWTLISYNINQDNKLFIFDFTRVELKQWSFKNIFRQSSCRL